jgi:superfamily II DNA or RNA helicase
MKYVHPSNPQKGLLFPLWIMKNFKQYILDEIIDDPNVDPCSIKVKKELQKYQTFLGKYLDYTSPYHDVLIYHGLGSGKTATAVNIISILYNYNPDWNIFIILPAILKETAWFRDLDEWLSERNKDEIRSKIYFISSNSPTADQQFLELIKKVDSNKKSLYIIDEVHNFIHNVYTNLKSKRGKKALTIYQHIVNEKQEGNDVRILCLSATPIKSNPFELSLLFNLLRPNSLPMEENKFNNLFLTSEGYRVLNQEKKNLFQRRILGLVSYYSSGNPNLYAKKKDHFIDLKMADYQDSIYAIYETIEKKLEMQSHGKSKIYKTYTRQASNFVFPHTDKRPRPSSFKISQSEAEKFQRGKEIDKKDLLESLNLYKMECNKYLTAAITHFNNIKDSDKHSLKDDIEIFLKEYSGDFNDFHTNYKNKSNLYNELYKCSAKMTAALFILHKCSGKVLFYSTYVYMEGLEVFKIYLSLIDINLYNGKNKNTFIEFHGGINLQDRRKNLNIFNSKENIDGSRIKIILLSTAGAEGISLLNTRQVIILEPNWDEELIKQIIGRAIRQCSHKDLPRNERQVDVYRLKLFKSNGETATDSYIESLAMEKQNLKESFLNALKEVAVDCQLFKNHNMLETKYNCFQFNQNAILKENPGPGYRKNIDDDNTDDNTVLVRKKVRKIQAALIGQTEVNPYLLDEETGIVYDNDLEFCVGQISKDDKGFFLKRDITVYEIDRPIEI